MSQINLSNSPKLIQQQRLILTQELQLFLKLINMTTIELAEYLEEQLIENPALEEDYENNENKDTELDNETEITEEQSQYLNNINEDLPFIRSHINDNEEDFNWENILSSTESLLDHLNFQLKLLDLTNEEEAIASFIIGNTNEDGYLEADLEEIAAFWANKIHPYDSSPDISESEKEKQFDTNSIMRVLMKIQYNFDPPGVFARNLKECLKIQATLLGFKNDSLAVNIIDNYLEEVGKKNYLEISNALNVDIDQVIKSVAIISSLEPKPGRPFYVKDADQKIVPDYFVYKVNKEYQIQLNRDIPKVRVSHYYRKLLKNRKKLTPETKKYIKEKLESAQRIIKCIEEREAAVKKVIKKIVEKQKEFFEYGKKYIKPLRLKDIAHDKDVDVHESTVSRITSRRYISTPQGVFELKSLFSRKIGTSDENNVSFEKLKSVLIEIIADESTDNPYSDEDISRILERRNIKIARRTVSKYRNILNIPSSFERALLKRNI